MIRIFTKKGLDKYVTDEVIADRLNFMDATARNAASNAVHSIVCMRTIETWRELLDKAEKSGDKYKSLAELIVEARIKK